MHDRRTGTTDQVSVVNPSIQANSFYTYGAALSGDGRYVAFTSEATNLVPGDTNQEPRRVRSVHRRPHRVRDVSPVAGARGTLAVVTIVGSGFIEDAMVSDGLRYHRHVGEGAR